MTGKVYDLDYWYYISKMDRIEKELDELIKILEEVEPFINEYIRIAKELLKELEEDKKSLNL